MTAPARQRADDATVIEQSWQEPEAFAELYDRHAGPILRYVTRRLGEAAADDVVAETFLAAFRRRRMDVSIELFCGAKSEGECRPAEVAKGRICVDLIAVARLRWDGDAETRLARRTHGSGRSGDHEARWSGGTTSDGTNSSGSSSPRVGCCHRTSASTARTRPVSMSTSGR